MCQKWIVSTKVGGCFKRIDDSLRSSSRRISNPKYDTLLEQYNQINIANYDRCYRSYCRNFLFVAVSVHEYHASIRYRAVREIGLRKLWSNAWKYSHAVLDWIHGIDPLPGGLLVLALPMESMLCWYVGQSRAKRIWGPPVVSVTAAVGSLVFSHGWYCLGRLLSRANKASKLDPIEALRYEYV